MSSAQVRQIMQRLLEKTRRGEVNWRSFGPDLPDELGLYFPNSIVSMHLLPSLSAPDRIVFSLRNSEGRVASESTLIEGDEEWDLAQNLFENARVTALGMRGILEEVEHAIMTEGPIGLPAELATGRSSRS